MGQRSFPTELQSQNCTLYNFTIFSRNFAILVQASSKHLLKALGPGILFASTCIGVSHLVQSTRAGADYGFGLILAIILANVFKYPFFEFASRYTSATRVSIIDGYHRKGKWILFLYLLITIPSMFIVSAAVTFVTAGLLSNLFNINLDTNLWAAIILAFCVVVLAVGKYSTLDNLLKVVGTVLVVSTIVAFVSAVITGPAERSVDFVPKDPLDPVGIIFMIALMGWMPTAVDISTWTSLWAEAKSKQTGYYPTLKESSFDFNFGYWISAILALLFLSLGALIVYGTGTELSNSSPVFADQIITMFTVAIGDWSYYVIAIAAFSTMFSTTITVLDGYGRAIERTASLMVGRKTYRSRTPFIIWTIIIAIGTFFIVSNYLNSLKQLVDLATIVSFVIAPLAAFLNYRVIYSDEVDEEHRPPKWLKNLALAGLAFLILFTGIFFWAKLNPESLVQIINP